MRKRTLVRVQPGTATMEISTEMSSNFKMFLSLYASQLASLSNITLYIGF